MKRPTIIAIVGPTASGKSALAVRLAQKFNGEVVSADSRQVYRGLDIGAGKLTKKEMGGVPHHLLDVASPRRRFTAARFKKLAEKKIKEILRRGRLPIVCGGTGFYLDALLGDAALPPAPPNQKLRRQLEKLNAGGLFHRLQKADFRRAQNIDRHNRRRLIRALEIANALGRVPEFKTAKPPYQVLKLGIKISAQELKSRIKTRLTKRLKQGLIAEVTRLHQSGLSWRRLDELGLEYRYVARYLQNKLTRQEMIEQLTKAIWHYAKRQLTWFRRDRDIHWVKNYHEAPKITDLFLHNHTII